MENGYLKIAAAVPVVHVADCRSNLAEIESILKQADSQGAEIVVFPELSITAYTCQDLFQQNLLLEEAKNALLALADFTLNCRAAAIVGVPISCNNLLYNCAAFVQGGKIYGLVPKTYIPNYHEFYEKRWFASAKSLPQRQTVQIGEYTIPIGANLIFNVCGVRLGIEICEDLWAVIPPSSCLAQAGAEIIVNLSASNEIVGKNDYARMLVSSQSARCLCGYVYCSSGWGESSQDLVFGGRAFIAENGAILSKSDRFSLKSQIINSELDVEHIRAERRSNTSFADGYETFSAQADYVLVDIPNVCEPINTHQELTRQIDPLPFVPTGKALNERCKEILAIQSMGLARRLSHTKSKTAIIGISGGLDSTLALLVCVDAFDCLGLDRKGIVGITMPGFGTTNRTYSNAINLMRSLGVTIREIPIREAVEVHFRDLGHDPATHDVTYENSQARERTQILMDAANQMGGFVVGTGDLSELALGWATYNGDHMSMYAVNASVPKTLVRHLVSWCADNLVDASSRATLLDIVDTPISPELIPADEHDSITQITEDLVGPYELHDFFLFHTLRYASRPSRTFKLACKAFRGEDERVSAYDDATIKKWLSTFYRRFFNQQFKRSCLPDGPKVGSCSLSPRGDWRMPSDAVSRAWLEECENL